jgi:hypothetical protein
VAPWLLYILFWEALTTGGALTLAFPFLVIWNLALFWLALDSWHPARPPRFWIAFSYAAAVVSGAAVICGLILVWRFWWTIVVWDYNPGVMLIAAPGLLLAAGALGVRRFLRKAASQRAENARRPTTAPASALRAG